MYPLPMSSPVAMIHSVLVKGAQLDAALSMRISKNLAENMNTAGSHMEFD
jgi:hypothetical protein